MRVMRHAGLLLTTTALGFGMAAPAAYAQDGQTETAATSTRDQVNPADIVVTARRVEERLQDVPISITVFSQEQLSNRNIVQPSDLATYTPSLAVNQRFGPEKSSFSIRGFTQELATAPSVAVYFADVVAPRANGPTTSGNGTTAGNLFDLQNVQVLKGPQGTLFGRNTTGGAVLLVPRRPTDAFEGYVEGSYGNHDMKRLQAVVNTPIGEDAAFRIGFDRLKREGYLRNRSGIGPDDFANVDYFAARASLLVDLTPDLETYFVASFSESDTHGTLPRMIACERTPTLRSGGQTFLAGAACDQLDRQAARGDGLYDVENNVPDPMVNLRQWQVINTTTLQVSDNLTVKNIVSYSEFRERSRFNINGDNLFVPATLEGNLGTPPVFRQIPTGTAAGQPVQFVAILPGPSGTQADQSTVTEELQVQGQSDDNRLRYQFGAYAEISNPLSNGQQISSIFMRCVDPLSFQCRDPLGPFAGGVFGQVSLQDIRYKFRNYALFGQGTFDLTSQLSVTGGLRYTWDRIQGTAANVVTRYAVPNTPTFSCTKTFVPIASLNAREVCRETLVEKSGRPTWLIDLDYKPNDDLLLYAKYARGYRSGLVNLIPTGIQFELTGPEKVDTYEVGAKATLRGAISGTFNVAAFYNDFSDQQIQANLIARPGRGVGGNVVLNAGRSRIQGVEVDASLLLFEGFRLDLAYAHLDTKLKSITLPVISPTDPTYLSVTPTALVGGELALSPKNRATVTATYTLPLDESIGRISFGATFTHTDKQIFSRADTPFVGRIGFDPGVLPATDLLNLNLNWNDVSGSPIDLSLFATNVTKEKYRVAITNAYGSAGYETAVLGEPRMYGARVRYRFGE